MTSSTNTRLATRDDLPALLSLAKTFHAISAWRHVPFREHDAAGAIYSAFEQGLAVVADDNGALVGFAIGTRTGLPFNRGFPVGAELAWYVLPAARGDRLGDALRAALESQAAAVGLRLWCMSTLSKSSPPSAAAALEAAGYTEFERTYIKAI